MKRIFTIIAALLVAATCCVEATALEYTEKSGVITVTLPDDYLVLTEANLSRNSKIIKSWGHSVDSFKRLMKEKNMSLYAVDSSGENQFQLKSWDSDVASAIGDMSAMKDDAVQSAAAAIGDGISSGEGKLLEAREIYQADHTFIRFTVNVDNFCYVQYLTVCNGKFYALVYYNNTPELTDAQMATAAAVFSTVKVSGDNPAGLFNGNNIAAIILLGAGMLAAVCCIAWVVVTFVRDVRRRRTEPDEIVPDRIEMRRK